MSNLAHPRPRTLGRVFFDAILRPHRSLSPRGFRLLIIMTAIFMFGTGLIFMFLGAWPVLGFCGVEFLLIYVMFRLNYRAARGYERVRLSDNSFEVRRVNPKGSQTAFHFEPTWLQVQIDNPPEHRSQLTVGSHGKRLTIGAFLTPEERLEVAEALRDALLCAAALPRAQRPKALP